MYQTNAGRSRRTSGEDIGSRRQSDMVTSTVVLTGGQIEILRRVAGVRTARNTSYSGKSSHSVSSVLRQVLEEARPLLEDELVKAGFPVIGRQT
jgi:hypothetical protein